MAVERVATSPTRLTVALVPNDTIGERMAGPGIRYWEFARTLGRRFEVRLIVPPFVPMEALPCTEGFPASLHICSTAADLKACVEGCDTIITRGVVLNAYPFLGELGKPLVLDMYSPVLLEGLQRDVAEDLFQKLTAHERDLELVSRQLYAGDFYLCADERQRDYWLGMLSAAGRVNPYTHGQDPTLRHLVDVVPFGLPEEPARHTRSVLKGVHQAIGPEDKVILWGGGIWNWLDAGTLIRAMAQVVTQRDDVKLFFMGIRRPNTLIPQMRAAEEAIALSRALGLYERHVFFNDWVPYAERQNYLLEADIGVSLHLDHVETRFAFRTRLLDCIWAGLPVLATAGDVLSEALAAQGLARLVQPGDVQGVAQGILALLGDPALRAESAPRFQRMAEGYRWERVVGPLVNFCSAPYLAPDREYVQQRTMAVTRSSSWCRLAGKSWRVLRLGGVRGLWQQAGQYLRWITHK